MRQFLHSFLGAAQRTRTTTRTARRQRLALEALENRLQPAAGPAPTYAVDFADAVTADNAFVAADGLQYWTIDAGADNYQNDAYERPTAQTYQVRSLAGGEERFAAAEYFANLDIVAARAGFNANYLFVSIQLAGLYKHTADGQSARQGLAYRYGFRLAREADGGNGLLAVADQPMLKNGAEYGGQGAFVYRDLNGDVGGTGLGVTKQDRPAEVNGNGYESVAASDGRLGDGSQVLWVRVSPDDPTIVEFALAYKRLGYTETDLGGLAYLEFEANKGLQDPGNYQWNDEYTKSEAGSPYRAASGDRGKSEFGTQGLGNIYELDTLRGGPIVPFFQASSLSGTVYFDANKNGVRDAGEAGVRGVLITLTGFDNLGAWVEVTTTTVTGGSYTFAGLRPGTYTLTETQPDFLDDGFETVGTINGAQVGANAENDVIASITLGPGLDGIGYDFGEFIVAN